MALPGNGNKETLNPNLVNTDIDDARTFPIFDGLTKYDVNGKVVNDLAEEITPNKTATEWTIRLPEGVEFHNGKTLTADDVVYTLQYNLDKKNATLGAGMVADVRRDGVKKVDARTIRLTLVRPNAFLADNLADFHLKVFPEGTTDFSKPVGTGPFKFQDWTPGERARYERFENYRVDGRPYLDGLEILSVADTQARVNALVSGQVALISSLPLTQTRQVQNNKDLQLIEVESAYWIAQYMWTSGPGAAPFDDPRVRQALRLLVDRKQVVDNVLQGHGRIGNDMFAWQDEAYPEDVPQREFDPEKAASLLKAAGHEKLSVDLWTGDITTGSLGFATLMPQAAKKAGVTIDLHKVPTDQYFSKPYGNEPFASTYWGGRTYVTQCANSQTTNAGVNETRWKDKEWQRMYDQALATVDRPKAIELLKETQRILHDRGGYIIPAFPNLVDAGSAKVGGLKPSPMQHLGNYQFADVYLRA
jgi:peptide/nickel transport system substrate-binding protein